jgi:hypothetical protein
MRHSKKIEFLSPKQLATSSADESMLSARERKPAINNRKNSDCGHQNAMNILKFYAQICQV